MIKQTENKQQGTANIADDRVLAPVYCCGWRYNFKKGVEHCKNRGTCLAHRNYNDSDEPYNLEQVRFDYIKDFRKCDRWLFYELRLPFLLSL